MPEGEKQVSYADMPGAYGNTLTFTHHFLSLLLEARSRGSMYLGMAKRLAHIAEQRCS